MTTQTKLSIIVNGVTYPLFDGSQVYASGDGVTRIYYLSDDGVGMSPVTRYASRGPFQHGETDIDFRLEPRQMVFIFALHAPTRMDLQAARRTMLELFRPSRTPVTIQYVFDDGSIRRIDCFLTGGLQFASSEREQQAWFQRFSVDLRAPDPTWYDPTVRTVEITNSTYGSGLAVPMPVPFHVGSSRYERFQDFVYDGSWETYPTIRIHGPIKYPGFTISESNAALRFSGNGGLHLASGEYIDILLSSGSKSIISNSGASMVPYLSEDSNLTDLKIVADPDSPGGVNTVYTFGDGANATTRTVITYTSRYIGV